MGGPLNVGDADDNPFDELAIIADAMRKLGSIVTIDVRHGLDHGTEEIWTVGAHRGTEYLIGQGGTLKAAVSDMTARATSIADRR